MSEDKPEPVVGEAYQLDWRDRLLAEQVAQGAVLSRLLWLVMHCAKASGLSPEIEDARRDLFDQITQDIAQVNFMGRPEPRASALRDRARAVAEIVVMQVRPMDKQQPDMPEA